MTSVNRSCIYIFIYLCISSSTIVIICIYILSICSWLQAGWSGWFSRPKPPIKASKTSCRFPAFGWPGGSCRLPAGTTILPGRSCACCACGCCWGDPATRGGRRALPPTGTTGLHGLRGDRLTTRQGGEPMPPGLHSPATVRPGLGTGSGMAGAGPPGEEMEGEMACGTGEGVDGMVGAQARWAQAGMGDAFG